MTYPATARITVLLKIDETKSGDAEIVQEQLEWAIANSLEKWTCDDQRVTGFRIIGDWPETTDIYEMSDPLGAP